MKKHLKYLLAIGLLLLSLGFMIYVYFGGYKFSPDKTEFTINLNNKEYQPIYIDNVWGATKLVAVKVTKISEVDSLGRASIEQMYVKLIKLSGIGSPEIHHAQFDGSTFTLVFAPGNMNKEEKVLLPAGGIEFNTESNAEIRTIGHNLSDLLKNKLIITNCSTYFDENGFVDDATIIEGDCLTILNEAGRICNGNCVHE